MTKQAGEELVHKAALDAVETVLTIMAAGNITHLSFRRGNGRPSVQIETDDYTFEGDKFSASHLLDLDLDLD